MISYQIVGIIYIVVTLLISQSPKRAGVAIKKVTILRLDNLVSLAIGILSGRASSCKYVFCKDIAFIN